MDVRYTPRPESMKRKTEHQEWLDFAGILLALAGFFNVIDGSSAIGGSSYVDDKVLFSSLDTWGWFFLIVGIIQIIAAVGVFKGRTWGAYIAIPTAFFNAIAHMSAADTYPLLSLSAAALNVLVIYGLIVHGGLRGSSAAR
jgi:uncharacterized membrane protein HdeD (DUF308 family)